jgi:predicted RNA binding protein YcfA (HicA-like mRNA interferase family)
LVLFQELIYQRGPIVKIEEIILILTKNGWFTIEDLGSSRQFKHPQQKGRITIIGNLNYDLSEGALNSILCQAGLNKNSMNKPGTIPNISLLNSFDKLDSLHPKNSTVLTESTEKGTKR